MVCDVLDVDDVLVFVVCYNVVVGFDVVLLVYGDFGLGFVDCLCCGEEFLV